MTSYLQTTVSLLWIFLFSFTHGQEDDGASPSIAPTSKYGEPGNIGNNFALATICILALLLSYREVYDSHPLAFVRGLGLIFISSVILVVKVAKDWILSDALFWGTYANQGCQPLSLFGILFQAVFLPLIFLSAGALASHVFKSTIMSLVSKIFTFIALDTAFAILAYLSWDYDTTNFGFAKNVLECGIYGCYAKDYETVSKENQGMPMQYEYNVVVGVVTFLFSILTGAYVLSLLVRTVLPIAVPAIAVPTANAISADRQKTLISVEGGESEEVLLEDMVYHIDEGGLLWTPRVSPSFKLWKSLSMKTGITLLVLLGLFLLLVTLGMLPDSWESFSAYGLISFAQGSKANGNGSGKTSDADGAPFKTIYWPINTGSDEVKPDFYPGNLVLKVYPDVLMFYLFLAILTIGGFLAHAFPTVRHAFHHRLRLPDLSFLDARPGPKWWWTWVLAPPWSISIGAIFVLVSFAVFLVFFLTYWAVYHTFHGSENDNYTHTEIAARVVGQLANVWMGLMLFPVSKNSILTSAFGIAWEQVIYVHVWMGEAFMAICALHMCLWWAVYADLDIFPNDVLAVPQNFPCNGECTPNNPHGDNWTIAMMTIIVWAMFVFMGVFAQNSVRRANFELFYYSHHFFLVVIIGVSWHAASACYFLIGGAGLFVVDRCLRAMNRARRWKLTSITVCPDTITRLELEPLDDFFGFNSKFRYSCGQYLYLNVPEISGLEWHPFTISSAPSDGLVTCHIKQAPAGSSTFTGKLHQLALNLSRDAEKKVTMKAPTVVNVDGPYGAWFDHTGYDVINLIAGGIGVTPCISIFRELFLQKSSGEIPAGELCGGVELVWTIQKREALEPFLDIFKAVIADSAAGGCSFKFQIFIDKEGDFGDDQHCGIPITSGRPDFLRLTDDLGSMASDGIRPHVFACGPPGMVAMVDGGCLKHQISFHKEVFAF